MKLYYFLIFNMDNKEIIDILNQIRILIHDYVIKNKINFTYHKQNTPLKIDLDFEISNLDFDEEPFDKCSIHGVTYIDVNNWISKSPGVKIADVRTLKVKKMEIYMKQIPIEAIIHTYIHELAHTVTIPEMIFSKNICSKNKRIQPTVDNKKNNSFMQNHHSDSFYGNFAKLLRISEELNIYVLPKTHRNFNIKNLQRYDSLINPNDLLSLGTSPLFQKKI